MAVDVAKPRMALSKGWRRWSGLLAGVNEQAAIPVSVFPLLARADPRSGDAFYQNLWNLTLEG